MLVNYIKIAIRIIQKSKVFFGINLLGLTLGMTTAILIMLYINYEFNFDKFHKDYNRIYRVCVNGKIANDNFDAALSNVLLADYLKTNFNEIEEIARLEITDKINFIKKQNQEILVKNFICADASFFKIFNCQWIEGSPENLFLEKNEIVISKKLADTLFPNESALGKKIALNNKFIAVIKGVINNYSTQSHLKLEGVLPMSFYTDGVDEYRLKDWGSLDIMTYIKLKENVNNIIFEAKIRNIINKNLDFKIKESGIEFFVYLKPITSIHLYPNLIGENNSNKDTDIDYIYILSAIAAFILIIACINFMNLSTARAVKRSREVAMRKVNGAKRWDLIKQFMGETLFLSFLALFLSLGIVEIILPYFNQFVERDLSMEMIFKAPFLFSILSLTIIVGVISGSYPAFYLSSFSPIKVLRKNLFKYRKKTTFRNMLVLFQFTISIILIICTLTFLQQISFINNKKLGFDKENILVLPIKSNNNLDLNFLEYIKKTLIQSPNVESVGFSKEVKGDDYDATGMIPEDSINKNPWLIFNTAIDDSYIPTMNMKIIEGRNFNYSFADTNAIIINQTLQKKLGWENPIGMKFNKGTNAELIVVGVVEDFNFSSLRDSLQPFVFFYNPYKANVLNIRIKNNPFVNTLDKIKEYWTEIMPDVPFDYKFLDKSIEEKYIFEKKIASMLIVFSFISIFIACLGLFGLASFAAEQRKKEIGIRKVLGANIINVTKMLIFDLTKWVIIANILAYPIAYFAMKSWLNNFAYHTNIGISNFVYATIIAFAIAIITVSIKVIKTAYDNPINSIKYE